MFFSFVFWLSNTVPQSVVGWRIKGALYWGGGFSSFFIIKQSIVALLVYFYYKTREEDCLVRVKRAFKIITSSMVFLSLVWWWKFDVRFLLEWMKQHAENCISLPVKVWSCAKYLFRHLLTYLSMHMILAYMNHHLLLPHPSSFFYKLWNLHLDKRSQEHATLDCNFITGVLPYSWMLAHNKLSKLMI